MKHKIKDAREERDTLREALRAVTDRFASICENYNDGFVRRGEDWDIITNARAALGETEEAAR